MERISPYRGYFIAAYSVEAGDQFIGYAKVCMDEPDSVWNATSVEKLTSATGCKTELDAIVAAEKKARRAIGDILGSWDQTSMPGALN